MYYPLSQITSNLYTNGNEFLIKDTNSIYSGYYWKTSKGKYYTGKTPQDVPIQELTLLTNQSLVSPISIPESDLKTTYYNQDDSSPVTYIDLKQPPPPPPPPTYSPTLPTIQDYQTGEFRRYFCKKANELIYLEINKDTYDKLVSRDPKILYQLYIPFNIPWQLTGNKEIVYKTNKNLVILAIFKNKADMFDKYLKEDYTKYYK